MNEQKKPHIELTIEQLDALVASFYPAMLEFFASDRGKKVYAEHLSRESKEASVAPLILADNIY